MKKNILIIGMIVFFILNAFILLYAGVGYEEYEVQEGESFLEVCEKTLYDCQANWRQLLKFNGLNQPTDVKPGMILKIPNSLSKNRYATVPFLVGDVEVYNAENDEWMKIRTNHALVEGNVLRTNEESRCEIKLDDGTILKLDSNTVIALGEFDFDEEGSQTLLDVISGSVLMKITKLGDDDEFNVKTVSAVAGVRGTEFQIKVSGENEDTIVEIAVLEGKIAAKATEDVDSEEELILSSQEGDEDTSADKIEKEEGGKTQMDKEKTIGVNEGYTVQFNWKSKETIVTKVPEQVTNITVNEVTEEEENDEDDDDDDEEEEEE